MLLPLQVQLYALLSVSGCFMDFHVDFGGSSVWYHVLRFLAHLRTLLFSELQVRCVSIRVLNVMLLGYVSGSKVFLLVPPTKANLMAFEEWSSSDRQASTFFPSSSASGLYSIKQLLALRVYQPL
jgi:hypothetical protein